MAWQTVMITYIRGITDDLGAVAVNADDKLQQLVVIAAMMVTEEVNFSNTYVMNVEEVTITPDPSNDVPFVNLVCLKTACMLARAEQKDRARKAFNVKDGPSSIDGRPQGEQTAKWADTICEDYAKAVLEYKLGNLQPGKAILGPYRFLDGSYSSAVLDPRWRNDDYQGPYFS